MSFEVPPVGRPQPVPAPQRVQPGVEAAGAVVRVDTVDAIPSAPPAELRAEMAAAAGRVDELREQGRELHFSFDESARRVVVEVRDLNGNVIRTIPPSEAIDIATGGQLEY